MISPESYRAWEEEMAAVRRACLACEQEAYLSSPDTDLGAVMPGVYYHAGRSARRGHGMTRDEHLLTILAEECAEVAHVCRRRTLPRDHGLDKAVRRRPSPAAHHGRGLGPAIGEMCGEMPPSRSCSACCSDVRSSYNVLPPSIAPMKGASGFRARLTWCRTPVGTGSPNRPAAVAMAAGRAELGPRAGAAATRGRRATRRVPLPGRSFTQCRLMLLMAPSTESLAIGKNSSSAWIRTTGTESARQPLAPPEPRQTEMDRFGEAGRAEVAGVA